MHYVINLSGKTPEITYCEIKWYFVRRISASKFDRDYVHCKIPVYEIATSRTKTYYIYTFNLIFQDVN